MKRSLILLFLMLLCCGTPNTYAISWQGIDWNSYDSASLFVNALGQLEVTPINPNYGAAHYNTPAGFRSSSTPWVEVSFLDNGGVNRVQMWMEDENYVTPNGGAWTQFGSWDTYTNYQIYWWDYDTDLTGGTPSFGFIDTGISRSVGEHTLKLGMQSNGTIDYLFDGNLIYSGNVITPNFFGDIYLAGRYDTAIFTNYSTGTDYEPIPEPTTMLLFGSGLIGLAGFRRRFKKS